MTSEKTKTSERWVTDGRIRFAGRTFNPPELIPYNNSIVHIAYDTFLDNTIDILDEHGGVIVQCTNRIAVPRTAAIEPDEPLAAWEMEAIALYQSPAKMPLHQIASELDQKYSDSITKYRVHNLLSARGLV